MSRHANDILNAGYRGFDYLDRVWPAYALYCGYSDAERDRSLKELKDRYWEQRDLDLNVLSRTADLLNAQINSMKGIDQAQKQHIGTVKKAWYGEASSNNAHAKLADFDRRSEELTGSIQKVADVISHAAREMESSIQCKSDTCGKIMPDQGINYDSETLRLMAQLAKKTIEEGDFLKHPKRPNVTPNGQPCSNNTFEGATRWSASYIPAMVVAVSFHKGRLIKECDNTHTAVDGYYDRIVAAFNAVSAASFPVADQVKPSSVKNGNGGKEKERAGGGGGAQKPPPGGGEVRAATHPPQTGQQPLIPGANPVQALGGQLPNLVQGIIKPLSDGLGQITQLAGTPGAGPPGDPVHQAAMGQLPHPPGVANQPGHTLAEYNASGNQVKLTQAANGAVSMQVTGLDGVTHNYKMRIDEHGKPVIDTAVAGTGQKKKEEDNADHPDKKQSAKKGQEDADESGAKPVKPKPVAPSEPPPPSSVVSGIDRPPAPGNTVQPPVPQQDGPQLASQHNAPPVAPTPIPPAPAARQEEERARPPKPSAGAPQLAHSNRPSEG